MTGNRNLRVDHTGIPGFHEHLRISEVAPTEENIADRGIQTLRWVIDRYGLKSKDGLKGTAKSPVTGRPVGFTMEHWKDRDPDSTYIEFAFTVVDPATVGRKLPDEDRRKVREDIARIKRIEFDFE